MPDDKREYMADVNREVQLSFLDVSEAGKPVRFKVTTRTTGDLTVTEVKRTIKIPQGNGKGHSESP